MDVTWIAVLVPALASSAQKPPKPSFGPPPERWSLAEDPYRDGCCIGDMYLPKGRLKSVTFHHDAPWSTEDPPGWEKRAVLRFDESGRCVETETWTMGTHEFSARVVTDPATGTERLFLWSWFEDQRRWDGRASEIVRDDQGRPTAKVHVPWKSDGSGPWVSEAWVQEEYRTDGSGSVVQRLWLGDAWQPSIPNLPVLQVCRRDSKGRVLQVLCGREEESLAVLEEYEYDARGNVVSARYAGVLPRWFTTSYRYDSRDRMIASTWAADGMVTKSATYEYSEDDRLVARSTCELGPHLSFAGQGRIQREETLEGIDRPLTSVVWNEEGREISRVRWTYEDDSRGNWVRKTFELTGLRGPDEYHVLRLIEYAD